MSKTHYPRRVLPRLGIVSEASQASYIADTGNDALRVAFGLAAHGKSKKGTFKFSARLSPQDYRVQSLRSRVR